jgi:hypothetical protein
MADLIGSDAIYQTLTADSALTTLLGGSYIYNGNLVPKKVTSQKTINFYRISPYLGGSEFLEIDYSIDCRAETEKLSTEIAVRVKEVLNRLNTIVNSNNYYFIADIGSTIPPVNQQDVYNTPVTVKVRRH